MRLYLDEAHGLGVPARIAEAIAEAWEATARDQGADSDFTTIVKPLENAAGVTVGRPPGSLAEPSPPLRQNMRMVLSVYKNDTCCYTLETDAYQAR